MLRRRSFQYVGARLALLAVWLQVVLALGHIHPWDIYLYGHPVVQGFGLTEVVADPQATPVPFAPLQANLEADASCPICANMALAGSLVLPELVRLPPPPALAGHAAVSVIAAPPPARKFLLFQTRAPPAA